MRSTIGPRFHLLFVLLTLVGAGCGRLGRYGEACEGGAACESGICVDVDGRGRCSQDCAAAPCPGRDECLPVGEARLCKPSPAPTGCTRSCQGKGCGPDGCGGTCGTCFGGQSCSAGVCKSASAGCHCSCSCRCSRCSATVTCNANVSCAAGGCEGSCTGLCLKTCNRDPNCGSFVSGSGSCG